MVRTLSQEARQKAIDATLEIVAEDGISAFTVEGVSRRSGVAKTTIYRHWNSGSELLVQALDCNVRHLPTPDTGTLCGDLEEFIQLLVGIGADPSLRRMLIDLFSAAAEDPELASVKQAMAEERRRPIVELVQRAVDRGEVVEFDIEEASCFIEDLLMAKMLLAAEPMTIDETPMIVRFLHRGLCCSGPSKKPSGAAK